MTDGSKLVRGVTLNEQEGASVDGAPYSSRDRLELEAVRSPKGGPDLVIRRSATTPQRSQAPPALWFAQRAHPPLGGAHAHAGLALPTPKNRRAFLSPSDSPYNFCL